MVVIFFLFFLEIWPDLPPEFHYQLTLELLINQRYKYDNGLTTRNTAEQYLTVTSVKMAAM